MALRIIGVSWFLTLLHSNQHPGPAAGVLSAGAQLASKVVILEEEFVAAELDVIGVQEGRSASTDIRTGLHYERYVGAADGDGSYGCEVWLRRAARIKMQAY